MVYEENCIYHVRGNMFYVSVSLAVCVSVYSTIFTHGCLPWWWADMNDSVFRARVFLRDRKCVCDGKYLLTRYDKPPKHFQFWSIHIFLLSVGGWSPFVHRLHLFSYCAFAVSNSVSAFNFFFFSFFLRLYLLEPIFHYELTEKVKFLKLHVWICCCCCWCICRMHFMDGKSKHLIVWYYFWAVVCSRKAFDWSFFLLFGWYIFVYKLWLSN